MDSARGRSAWLKQNLPPPLSAPHILTFSSHPSPHPPGTVPHRSGYNVKKRNLAVLSTKRDKVIALNANSRADLFDKEKEELFRAIVASFRVR